MLALGGGGDESISSSVSRTTRRNLYIDLSLYTYRKTLFSLLHQSNFVFALDHPVLIGRLPTAWLATENEEAQPRALIEAREEQKQIQVELLKRIVERQRFGAENLEYNGENDSDGDDFDESSGRPLLRGIFFLCLSYNLSYFF